MLPNQNLKKLNGKMFLGMVIICAEYKPDIVFVYGVTNTSVIYSMVAFYRSFKIAHVEAGLRTINKFYLFPEEVNRQITGRLVDYHFSPTEVATENLIKEGVG